MTNAYEDQRKRDLTMLVFAAVYIVVGLVLVYLRFTNAISSTVFAIGIAVLIVASLIVKFAGDFLRKRK